MQKRVMERDSVLRHDMEQLGPIFGSSELNAKVIYVGSVGSLGRHKSGRMREAPPTRGRVPKGRESMTSSKVSGLPE